MPYVLGYISLYKRCNLCYVETIYNCIPVSYNTILISIHSTKTICFKRKSIHIYAFHLRKGGVI